MKKDDKLKQNWACLICDGLDCKLDTVMRSSKKDWFHYENMPME